MNGIGLRAISALVFTTILILMFWLAPNVEPQMFGATTPDRTAVLFAVIFAFFWTYLVIQGYAISHGFIGSSSVHNLDNIVSGFPAIVALFGIFVHFAGYRDLSSLNMLFAVMTLFVVAYDLWVLGGAAAKINRLTDEFKHEH